MSRNKTLPPFIHPKILEIDLDDGNGKGNAMEPLANCVSLMHMIGSEVKGSRKLFWKNVRFECERLCAEVRTTPLLELIFLNCEDWADE